MFLELQLKILTHSFAFHLLCNPTVLKWCERRQQGEFLLAVRATSLGKRKNISSLECRWSGEQTLEEGDPVLLASATVWRWRN